MESHNVPHLREVIVFLALTGLLIPFLQRFRFSKVLGFLVLGTLVGPYGLGSMVASHTWMRYFVIPDLEGVQALAELGVVFLLFVMGLELSPERLWSMRRWVFGAGTLQVSLSALTIGGIAWCWGNRWESALILGLVLALSSTALVVQLLGDRKELGAPVGRASFSVLLLQDLAVVPLLVLVDVFGSHGSGNLVTEVAAALGKAVAAMAVIYVVGRGVLRPIFRYVAENREPDAFMALTLLATLGIAGLTAAIGLSMALGAFLAGLMLAETEYRHEVQVSMEPFKGLLMALFFMSVGMAVNLGALLDDPVWILLSVFGLAAIKASIVTILFRRFDLSWGSSVQAGLLLGQGGEFAFIIIGMAMLQGLINEPIGQFMLLVVGVSMAATPLFAQLGEFLGRLIDRMLAPPEPAGILEIPIHEGHVIIAGYGRVGQMLASVLDSQRVPWIALETDAARVTRHHDEGEPVFLGDASRADILHSAHAGNAQAIVITMDHPASAHKAVNSTHAHFPQVPVIARARDAKHARLLRRDGASKVILETLESSLQLAEHVLQQLGVPELAAGTIIQQHRELHQNQEIESHTGTTG